MSDLLDTLRDALVDRYALERELGRGGMATVFLAEDVKHRRKVAIKVLHPDIAAAIGPERFLREIEIAAQLQHPHILPLYDSGAAGSYLFYVMPFVEGESLRDRLNREKQLPQEDVLKITSEVASALGYAHSRGIVHRDIKPENIMLSGGSAVVADFGIARAASAVEQQQLTQTGTVVGTPAYMSPEQGTGDPNLDGRSDQYSLSCVVYEMLVGQPPFTGPNVQAVIARHTMDFVSPPSIVRETIPETMEAALLRALAKVPADRYPTVIMFAEALAAPSPITAAERRRSTIGTGGAARSSVVMRAARPGWLRALQRGAPVVGLLVAAWAARSLWSGSRRPAALEGGLDPRHIAVLYFDERSEGVRYLADGFTEALIRELGGVDFLQVTSRNGVAAYRDTRASPESIGRALRVGTLVKGTVAQSGDRLRVTVEMISTSDGSVVSSPPLERLREDVFALQDDLAKEVSQFLRQRLGQVVEQLETRAGTSNVAAWELVQQAVAVTKGVDSLLASRDTATAARELVRADSLLARASEMDRKWVEPVLERGWVAFEARNLAGLNKSQGADWIARGTEFASRALSLKPDDAEALQLRGTMRYFRWVLNLDPAPLTSDGLLAAAEQDLRAGTVDSNPDRARAWLYLSHLLMRKSETADAKLAALRAYEADPYLKDADLVLWRLFQSSLDLEDGAEASKWCHEAYRRFPKDPFFIECQIELYALKDQRPDIERAWQLLGQNVGLYAPSQREYRRRRGEFLVAMALARAGLKDSSGAVALRARTADPAIDPTREFAYLEMLLRNLLGETDEALAQLKLYLATNPQDRGSVAKDDTWWLRGLRDDPRFKQLVGISK